MNLKELLRASLEIQFSCFLTITSINCRDRQSRPYDKQSTFFDFFDVFSGADKKSELYFVHYL